ncbi:conserved hypothetical protein [Mycobacterium tuberculosis T46]|nr:conserved hypothetical protein [Mycobacterium tuberculosis T46]
MHWLRPDPTNQGGSGIKRVLGILSDRPVSSTMVGGGRVREELTSVDPPRSFGYTLTDIKGPLAPLVALVEGKWSFAPADTGTTVTWQWTIHPRSALAAPVLPVFARMWRGYARGVLEKLSALLVG